MTTSDRQRPLRQVRTRNKQVSPRMKSNSVNISRKVSIPYLQRTLNVKDVEGEGGRQVSGSNSEIGTVSDDDIYGGTLLHVKWTLLPKLFFLSLLR